MHTDPRIAVVRGLTHRNCRKRSRPPVRSSWTPTTPPSPRWRRWRGHRWCGSAAARAPTRAPATCGRRTSSVRPRKAILECLSDWSAAGNDHVAHLQVLELQVMVQISFRQFVFNITHSWLSHFFSFWLVPSCYLELFLTHLSLIGIVWVAHDGTRPNIHCWPLPW